MSFLYKGNFGLVLLPDKNNTIISSNVVANEGSKYAQLKNVVPYLPLFRGHLAELPGQLVYDTVRAVTKKLPLTVLFNPTTSSNEKFFLWDVVEPQPALQELHQLSFVFAQYAVSPDGEHIHATKKIQLTLRQQMHMRRYGYPFDARALKDAATSTVAPWRVTFDRASFSQLETSGEIEKQIVTVVK